MKIAVISDIHGNLLALEAVLADIARQGVDRTVNLGDILSGPLQPAETADLLMAQDFITIRGNHERQLLALLEPGAPAPDSLGSDGFAAGKITTRQADWLRGLPAARVLEPGIRLCHGTPDTDLQYWLETVVPGFGKDGATGTRPATTHEVRERLGNEQHALVLCAHTHVWSSAAAPWWSTRAASACRLTRMRTPGRMWSRTVPPMRVMRCWNRRPVAGTSCCAPCRMTLRPRRISPAAMAGRTGRTRC
jgi:predicted phosphodiesterase